MRSPAEVKEFYAAVCVQLRALPSTRLLFATLVSNRVRGSVHIGFVLKDVLLPVNRPSGPSH